MTAITLLTDFGLKDEYVGVMKGVILSINPQADLIDISHQIAPQDVAQAGRMLAAAYAWFPGGTVHLAVVDPGVGSERAAIAARHNGHLFVAPDNGLLSDVWGRQGPDTAVRVENSRFFRHPVSRTFHGRDVFAPVAAHLAAGVDLTALGPALPPSQVIHRKVARAALKSDGLAGTITEIDHFGNLRTNIGASSIEALIGDSTSEVVVHIGRHSIHGLSETYADGGRGELMALVGGRGQLEIAVNCGNAAQFTGASPDADVRVVCKNAFNQNIPEEED